MTVANADQADSDGDGVGDACDGPAAGTGSCQGKQAAMKQGSGADETLKGTHLRDALRGAGGSDSVKARGGRDCVKGGKGADRVLGGAGKDRLSGGGGRDTIKAADGRRDRVKCGRGRDTAVVDRKDGVEKLRAGDRSQVALSYKHCRIGGRVAQSGSAVRSLPARPQHSVRALLLLSVGVLQSR